MLLGRLLVLCLNLVDHRGDGRRIELRNFVTDGLGLLLLVVLLLELLLLLLLLMLLQENGLVILLIN